MGERDTIRRIREAVSQGNLVEPFTAQQANVALGIDWGGSFLPKHRVGNPGGYTQLFVRVNSRPALYRLKCKTI